MRERLIIQGVVRADPHVYEKTFLLCEREPGGDVGLGAQLAPVVHTATPFVQLPKCVRGDGIQAVGLHRAHDRTPRSGRGPRGVESARGEEAWTTVD